MNSGQRSGSLTAPRLGRAIDPCNLAVDSLLDLSDARVHESLGRKNKGLHDLAPVGLAPVAEKSISGSAGGHSSCKSENYLRSFGVSEGSIHLTLKRSVIL